MITATFSTDFARWNEGLKNAQASLKSFELSTVGVKQQLQRMVSGFDGSKIIRDAQVAAAAVSQIGGAAKLTAAEQRKVNATVTEAIAKYQALGEVAPKELHDLAEATKQVEKPTAAAAESVGSLVAKYLTIGAAISLAKQAFSALGEFIGSSVRSFASAEAAQTRLVTALRAQGTATPEVIGQYNRLASTIQKTTAFSDDAANAMEALFVQVGNVGPAQMEKATTAATDLAAGLGIDLEQAATLVSKALAGNTGALGRYGVKLDEARVAAEGADFIFGQLQERFGGQAAAQLETYAGKLAQLGNAWDNVKEAVGKFVVTNEVSTAVLNALSAGLNNASDASEAAAPSIAEVWIAMGQSQVAAAGIALLENYLSLVNEANRGANVFADAVRKGQVAPPPAAQLTKPLPNISGAGIAEWERQNEALDRAKKAAEAARKSLSDLRDELSGAKMRADIVQLGKAWDALTEEQQASAFSIDTTGKKYLQLIPAIAKVPPELRRTVTEMNRVAIAAGLMDDTVQQGALSVGLLGTQLQSIDGPAGDAIMAMVEFESHVTSGADIIGKFGQQLGKPEFREFPKTLVRMSDVTGQLAQGFVNLAQVSGGTFSAVARNIGKIAVGFDNALKGFETFKDTFIKNGEALKGVGLQMAASIGAGLLSGFGSIMEATSSTSLLKNVMGGAAAGGIAGAGIGAAIAVGIGKGAVVGGIWGAFAGAAIGVIVGVFRGAHTRGLMKQVGREWGVEINEGMAKEIERTAKDMFHGNLDAAKLFKMDEILGDVNADTVKQFGARLHDVFSALETGAFTAAQAVEVLDKNFKNYAEFVTKDGALASQALLDLIKLNERFGTGSAAVAEFVTSQTSRALGGLATFLDNAAVTSSAAAKSIGEAVFAAFGALQAGGASPLEALSAVTPILEKLDAQLKASGIDGGAAFAQMRDMAALAKDAVAGPLITAIASLNDVFEGLHNSGMLNQEMFSGLAQQVGETYQKLVAAGKGGDQALQLIAPTLQTLFELENDFGYKVDAATQALIDQGVAAGKVGDEHRTAQDKMARALDRTANAVEFLAKQFGYVADEIDKTTAAINKIPRDIKVGVHYTDSGFRPQPSEPTGGTGTRDTTRYYETGGVVSLSAYKASKVSQYLASGGPVHKAVGALAASALLATAMPAHAMAHETHTRPAALYAATGAFVAKGTDTVPAMLTPGEYVLPTTVVQKEGLPKLEALRDGSATIQPYQGSAPHAMTSGAGAGGAVAYHASGGLVLPSDIRAPGGIEIGPVRADLEIATDKARKALESIQRQPPITVNADVDTSGAEKALGHLPDAVPDGVSMVVTATATGLTDIATDIQALPQDQTFELLASSAGLADISSGIAAIPTDRAFELLASSNGLDPIVDGINAIPTERAFQVLASARGLKEITNDVQAIPTERDFRVLAVAFGLQAIVDQIDRIPTERDLLVLVRAAGIEETLIALNAIPTRRDVAVIVTPLGIAATLAALNTIPTVRAVAVPVAISGLDDVLEALAEIPSPIPVDVTLPPVSKIAALVDAILVELARIPNQIIVNIGTSGSPGSGSPGSPGSFPSPVPYPDNFPTPLPYPDPRFPLPTPLPYPGPVIGSGGGSGGSFGTSTSGGGSMTMHVTINALDGADVERVLRTSAAQRALVSMAKENAGGFRTDLRDGLGVR